MFTVEENRLDQHDLKFLDYSSFFRSQFHEAATVTEPLSMLEHRCRIGLNPQHWDKLQPIASQRPLAMGCTWHWWDSNLSHANKPCLQTPSFYTGTQKLWRQRGNENDTVWPCTKSTYIWNANMLMLTFSFLLWGLVVQTCDGGCEVNDEIMYSGDVYVSVLECHGFFLSHAVSLRNIRTLFSTLHLPIFN